jgi:hypothetical protein
MLPVELRLRYRQRNPQVGGLPAIKTNRILVPTQGYHFPRGGTNGSASAGTSDHPAGLSVRRSAQLSHFSKRVTCRLQSYFRAGLVSQNSFGRYLEPADHADNTYLMGLCIDRRLVSSLRLQIGSAATPNFSSLELFQHVLEPILRSDKTVIDMS